MINKTNIEVQIYLDTLMEGINQAGMLEMIAEEFGIDPIDLKEGVIENFSIQASINFEERGDAELDEDQFGEILHKSAVECTIESMVQKGLLIKSLEDGEIENTYTVNPIIKENLKNK
jgi:hypothetical protein